MEVLRSSAKFTWQKKKLLLIPVAINIFNYCAVILFIDLKIITDYFYIKFIIIKNKIYFKLNGKLIIILEYRVMLGAIQYKITSLWIGKQNRV